MNKRVIDSSRFVSVEHATDTISSSRLLESRVNQFRQVRLILVNVIEKDLVATMVFERLETLQVFAASMIGKKILTVFKQRRHHGNKSNSVSSRYCCLIDKPTHGFLVTVLVTDFKRAIRMHCNTWTGVSIDGGPASEIANNTTILPIGKCRNNVFIIAKPEATKQAFVFQILKCGEKGDSVIKCTVPKALGFPSRFHVPQNSF